MLQQPPPGSTRARPLRSVSLFALAFAASSVCVWFVALRLVEAAGIGPVGMSLDLACMFGFELPNNFAEPYLSRSPSEFWRRWRTSLSRWLRDYLYIPLGGNRRGPVRTSLHLLLTMLLGGLWHGASWTFVAWGGLHGLLLLAERAFRPGTRDEAVALRARDLPQVVLLFQCVCLIWVAFRAPTLGVALEIWKGLFTQSYGMGWPVLPVFVVASCAVLHFVERALRPRLPELQARIAISPCGSLLEGAAFGTIVTTAIVASGAGAELIHFQF
ncbi:MAG TPA: MBOAT family O-acyltransferase [Polyangiales bacterium]